MVIWSMIAVLAASVMLLVASIICTVVTIRRCGKIDDDTREIADNVKNAMSAVCDKAIETCTDLDDED